MLISSRVYDGSDASMRSRYAAAGVCNLLRALVLKMKKRENALNILLIHVECYKLD